MLLLINAGQLHDQSALQGPCARANYSRRSPLQRMLTILGGWSVESELQSLRTAAQDQSRCLRLLDTLNEFCTRLLGNADRLDLMARRKIIRLLVKEILVGRDTIIIQHSIPIANSPSRPPDSTPPAAGDSGEKYRL